MVRRSNCGVCDGVILDIGKLVAEKQVVIMFTQTVPRVPGRSAVLGAHSRSLLAALLGTALWGTASAQAQITSLTWDPNGSLGVQDGNGTWNTGLLNLSWNSGLPLNLPWPVILGGLYEARFGNNSTSGSFSVTVDSVPVNDLTFVGPSHYTLNNGNLQFAFPGLGGSNHLTAGSNVVGTINSAIDGTLTSGALIVQGGGTIELGGANIFQVDDTLSVRGATLRATTSQALGAGVLELDGPGSVFEAGANNLSFGNAVRLVGGPADNQIVVGGSNTLTLSGGIANGSSAGGFTKSGTGTLVLSGANTYTGATNVAGGTVRVTETGSLTSPVSVASGATLDLDGVLTGSANIAGTLSGSGTITGLTTIQSGGILDIDGLHANGGLTLESGAKLVFDVSGDPLHIIGPLNIASAPVTVILEGMGNGTLSFLDTSGITNLGSLPPNAFVLGPLPPALEGSTLVYNGTDYELHVVPEPSSLWAAGLVALCFVRWRPRLLFGVKG